MVQPSPASPGPSREVPRWDARGGWRSNKQEDRGDPGPLCLWLAGRACSEPVYGRTQVVGIWKVLFTNTDISARVETRLGQ